MTILHEQVRQSSVPRQEEDAENIEAKERWQFSTRKYNLDRQYELRSKKMKQNSHAGSDINEEWSSFFSEKNMSKLHEKSECFIKNGKTS